MSSNQPSEFEAIVYFRVGVSETADESVSSFVLKITDKTSVSDLETDLSVKLSRAALDVGTEFIPNLLKHFYNAMDEENNDKKQAEPGAGERPSGN